ncbi:hypothetical protein GGR52DRAFT_537448 [Hypoxylon sp. FL1284]|nr:hypothetical protein GGR52DRAFT_537448 [Hypoxylon sp. FL1284]
MHVRSVVSLLMMCILIHHTRVELLPVPCFRKSYPRSGIIPRNCTYRALLHSATMVVPSLFTCWHMCQRGWYDIREPRCMPIL